MKEKNLNLFVGLGFIIIFLSLMNPTALIGAQSGPVIHIDPITYTFPTVFEGEILSYDFVISNRGATDLEIKDVTHQ